MKKTIIKVITFILGLFLIIAILSYMFYPKKVEVNTFRNEGIDVEKDNTIDTLFIGSSLAYTSIAPINIYDKYGFTSYVLGGRSQSLDVGLHNFKRTLKTQKLKLLVIEADTFFKKRTPSYDLNNYLKNFAPIFKYHQRSKNYRYYKDLFKKVPKIERQFTKGYYYINTNKVPDDYDWMKESAAIATISKENYKTLDKFVKIAKKNNVEIVIFSTPSILNWNYPKHNAVSNFAKENNIEYIDMNLIPEININWKKDTKDGGDHLNYRGAYKVTDYFADYMNSLGYLKDHRNDKNYKSWDEDSIKYHEYEKTEYKKSLKKKKKNNK